MHCINGAKFIQNADQTAILHKKLADAQTDIKQLLFPLAQTPHQSQLMELKGSSIKRIIPPSTTILQIDTQEWASFFRAFSGARGLQNSLFSKIFLQTNNWCLETLLHEALHSFSIFAADIDLRQKYSVFEDGITEFFTGYLLFKKYFTCYSSWLNNTFDVCTMTYSRSVKRFYAFCCFVNIQNLANLYFWQPGLTWANARINFIKAIHSAGYPKFADVLDPLNDFLPDPSERFFDECLNNFGGQFRSLISSKVDFSKLK